MEDLVHASTGRSVTSWVVRKRSEVSSTATVPSSVPRGTGTAPRRARGWGLNWTMVVAGTGPEVVREHEVRQLVDDLGDGVVGALPDLRAR